jgi:hypothetical protein
MKNDRSLLVLLILVLLFSMIAVAQQGTGRRKSPHTAHVKGHGCLKQGNISGCYVVNDYGADRKYNVFFRDTKPDPDTGISFEGIGYGHLDPHCNQGQKVEVTAWKPLAGECPQRAK